MLCVCGHTADDHVPQELSVPLLPNPKPLYALPLSGIGTTRPESPYKFDLCHCGCAEYIEDNWTWPE